MKVTMGSLCSGYDGIGRGLSLALPDMRTLWHSEVDADMSTALAKHDPDVPNVGDLLTAPWHLAPHVDLLTSGDPCQSMSIAGRKLASADERFLWPAVIGVIRTVRPDAVFLENVQNITSVPLFEGGPKGGVLKLRLDDLRAAGYECRWTVLGACAVGAPHHRHRWYLVGRRVPDGQPVPEAVRVGAKAICGAPRSGGRFLLPTPMARDGDPTRSGEGDEAYWDARRANGRSNGMPLGAAVAQLLPTPDASEASRGGFLSPPAALLRIADPNRSSNLQDVVSSLLLPTPTAQNNHGNGTNGRGELLLPGVVHLLPTVRASDGEKGRGNPGQTYGSAERQRAAAVATLERWGKYAEAVALWEQITGVPAPEPTVAGAKGGRRLSPLLPEWMMGLPTGLLTGHLDRAAAIKGAGNGVVPLAVAAAWRLLTT